MRRVMWVGCWAWLGLLPATAPAAEDADPATAAQSAESPKPPPVPTPPPEPSPSEGFTPAEPAVLGYPFYPPLGFTGKSSVLPLEEAVDEYVPLPDRWRVGFPAWDRYAHGHPLQEEYPYQL